MDTFLKPNADDAPKFADAFAVRTYLSNVRFMQDSQIEFDIAALRAKEIADGGMWPLLKDVVQSLGRERDARIAETNAWLASKTPPKD